MKTEFFCDHVSNMASETVHKTPTMWQARRPNVDHTQLKHVLHTSVLAFQCPISFSMIATRRSDNCTGRVGPRRVEENLHTAEDVSTLVMGEEPRARAEEHSRTWSSLSNVAIR
ncbi:hypothetical protein H2248_004689 [Termitomyces sp. 'cryptogamus']|nr:hypothetical protein H2248_004689 [Termitomyces sp. 'cryptogamus']